MKNERFHITYHISIKAHKRLKIKENGTLELHVIQYRFMKLHAKLAQ